MDGQQKFDDIKCVSKTNLIFIELLHALSVELDGRAGGYLCVSDMEGLPVFLLRMGEMPEEKLNQYYTNALEKALRLSYTRQFAGYTLSRDSRDEERQRWTGAISGKSLIWSFSGFPEDCDEMFMVTLALGYGDISYHEACVLLNVGHLNEHPYFKKMDGLLKSLAGTR